MPPACLRRWSFGISRRRRNFTARSWITRLVCTTRWIRFRWWRMRLTAKMTGLYSKGWRSTPDRHDCDPEFHRLLLHSALEEHELAQMFWEKFVTRVYRILGTYIRQRQ